MYIAILANIVVIFMLKLAFR